MNDSVHAPGANAAYRFGRSMLGTVPIVLVGSMALTMNVTTPVFSAERAAPPLKRPGVSPAPPTTVRLAAAPAPSPGGGADGSAGAAAPGVIETASVPATYRVVAGDTVSGIAERFGLSTASVLALNGLSWKSTIFAGQTLQLSRAKIASPAPARGSAAPVTPASSSASTYLIVRGDTLSAIAKRHDVSTQALLAANGLSWSSIIYPGQRLSIPSRTAAAVGTAPVVAAPVAAAPIPAAPAATPSNSASYTIRSGDTLSSIARIHGTTVEALLAANGLNWTSTLYAGKTLRIPAVSGGAALATASVGGRTPIVSNALSPEQRSNARTIIQAGRNLGVSDYGIVIALAAAAQESDLNNLTYGDRDSVGLFQQRPSMGWGSRAQLLNTSYAAQLFFGGKHNPNAGKTRGLLDIPGWSTMSVTQAAQAVQVSAYPDAYAQWEGAARSWLATL